MIEPKVDAEVYAGLTREQHKLRDALDRYLWNCESRPLTARVREVITRSIRELVDVSEGVGYAEALRDLSRVEDSDPEPAGLDDEQPFLPFPEVA